LQKDQSYALGVTLEVYKDFVDLPMQNEIVSFIVPTNETKDETRWFYPSESCLEPR
jgi:hypothetical protein